MALRLVGHVELPPNKKIGGFDHAAVHRATARVYVAHTANDAIDVIDAVALRYLASIEKLPAVAGALVSDDRNLVFTSNRGENTVGMFTPGDETGLVRVAVGIKPNGLAYDAERNVLLAANVGDPAIAGSHTVTAVDVGQRAVAADIPVAGRTRWTVFDAVSQAFYVNIMEPAEIVVIDSSKLRVTRAFKIPAAGPHGLDIDPKLRRLFCACDAGVLAAVHIDSGEVLDVVPLAGAPDVIFFNPRLRHLYVAIGDPGVIEVFDVDPLRRIEVIRTEAGAHTLAFDADRDTVYAFLPESHRASVYVDRS